jgi:hypothetical protein
MSTCELEARDWKPPTHAASANDYFFRLEPQPALGCDGVRIYEARSASLLVYDHSQRIELPAQRRMRTHIVDHVAHTRQQPGIVQYRSAHSDAVLT